MIIVGIGEYFITNDQDETIITHALGSCVALIVYCRKTKHTALAHIVLPEPSHHSNLDNYKLKPSYFATDIVPELLQYFIDKLKCNKDELEVHIIGGADAISVDDVFLVGKKNVAMIKGILKNYNIKIDYIDTGGNISRTVSVKSSNGFVNIRKQKMIL